MGKLLDILLGLWYFCIDYLSPGLIIILISYIITKNKIKWYPKELLVIVIPFILWFLLLLLNIKGKTLANVVEARYISYGIGVINVLSIFIFKHDSPKKPTFDILTSSLLALVIYFVFPMLPE